MPEFLSLGEWGGTSAGRPFVAQPVPRLWVHHSVTNRTGNPAADFRAVNQIGLSNGHGGISYSYVIEGDTIGEGQGLRIGAHTAVPGHDENPYSFGVCFIGNFNNDTLTDADVNSFRWLRDVHLAGVLVADPPTDGHRNAPGQSTACPGNDTMLRLDDLRAPYAPPAPPPEIEGENVESLVTSDQLNYFYVDGEGRLVTYYYPLAGGAWGVFQIASGAKPNSQVTLTVDSPNPIDIGTVAANGRGLHAWYAAGTWHNETLPAL